MAGVERDDNSRSQQEEHVADLGSKRKRDGSDDEDEDEELSYEQERLKNIQDNAALMSSLGLSSFQPTSTHISKPHAKPATVVKRQPVPRAYRIPRGTKTEPTRRSGRISASASVAKAETSSTGASGSVERSASPAHSKIKPLPPRERRQVPSIALSSSSLLQRAPLPSRSTDGTLTILFEPPFGGIFTPNVTPLEMFAGGAFGGAFFRDTYSNVLKRPLLASEDIPEGWAEKSELEGKLSEDDVDPARNRFDTTAGSSLEDWEKAGWIWAGDPRGWAQWYCRFYQGRRTEDDERQIKRWLQVCGPRGRFLTGLLKKINAAGEQGVEDDDVGRKVRQVVWQWGFQVNRAVWQEALQGR